MQNVAEQGLGGGEGMGYERTDWENDSGGGDTERERGRGTCDGVNGRSGTGGLEGLFIFTFVEGFELDATREVGFFLTGEAGGGDGGSRSSAGLSWTFGSPACGPLKFRIDEKCSQSW